jgi:GTP-binding protein
MKFVDHVNVHIKAGDGGRGCVSFRREKFVPKGGPDGGDGGRGGNIIVRAKKDLNTLLDLRYHKIYNAQRGEHGMGSNRHGKNGEDTVILVPVGTLIKDAVTEEIIADLDADNAEVIAAKAGRGGLGNSNFATATRQAPRFAQPGEEGEQKELVFELKLLADVGLIGLPNAGKSTLISVISAAKPKIADYPFTTLIPNLGVVKLEEFRSFVVADIPGLIEGAHRGSGLGFQFLRHVERTSILLHLVDVSDILTTDPVEDFEKINNELVLYSPELMRKPMVVAGTKLDLAHEKIRFNKLLDYCRDKKLDFFPVCSVTGEGVKELVMYLAKKIVS